MMRGDDARSVQSSAMRSPMADAAAKRRTVSGAAKSDVRVFEDPAFRALVMHAAQRYRPSGRGPYYFARGKLGGDPVFAALLRDGRIASGARVLDIGCGLGVLAALLSAAEQSRGDPARAWPEGWKPAPTRWTLHGFDVRAGAIATAQRAMFDMRDRVDLQVADARDARLPVCDVAVFLDVLHYLDADVQQRVLARVHAALRPGGVLLLRIADAQPNWRFRYTYAIDWLVTLARGVWPRLHCRPLSEWQTLLDKTGFRVASQPMSEGTPFANVLLIATKTS